MKRSHRHKSSFVARHRRVIRWLCIATAVLVGVLLAVWIVFLVSPWPSALLIRKGFDDNSAKVAQSQAKSIPSGITQVESQQYRHGDSDAKLDVFYGDHTTTPQATIVWVHGGAWVSGNKEDVDNYMQILAAHGFTTVSVNYSIAPEKQYPTPIFQLNDALGYLQQNAKRLHIDDSRVFMAGDSAGSQIVAQVANAITSPSYAQTIGMQPQLSALSLKGLLLNCGAYDLTLPDYNGPFGKFLHTVLWAYSGTQDFLHDSKLQPASVANYLTPKFPPSFITAGNIDPLLAQSTELADRLQKLGVKTDTLFYAADHQPQLNHEYQFDFDTADSQNALRRMIDFAQQQAK
jgi:acetyl esterase/lipase